MEQIKQRMKSYWTQRADSFSGLRMREFSGDMHQRWLAEFHRYLPGDRKLNILDLGTGTGFFALLLGQEGHRVTGIDMTEKMIEKARGASRQLGIDAEFSVMDAEQPAFAKGSFDVLVTRNLTWGLPNLGKAYQSWHELLKPGGILINFDANYCGERQETPLPEHHAHNQVPPDLMEEYEQLKAALRPGQQPRPLWDAKLLATAGFSDIRIDTGVWRRIYQEVDEFYNPTPIFTITACA